MQSEEKDNDSDFKVEHPQSRRARRKEESLDEPKESPAKKAPKKKTVKKKVEKDKKK